MPDEVTGNVVLKSGRAKPVRQHHPWLFSGAIATIARDATNGDLVNVVDADGAFLARGYLNRRSQIVVRLLSWEADDVLDDAFWRRRLARAIDARMPLDPACRLVNAESDGLPGLVVDRYGPWLVVQALTLGIARRLERVVALLVELWPGDVPLAGIYERSDVDVRAKEGIGAANGVAWGAAPPPTVEIAEVASDGRLLRLLIDIPHGHKTGFYLDQRDNRRQVACHCNGAEVLNLFSYSGGFGVHALAAGARRVVHVDTSAPALALARENVALNGFAVDEADFVAEDVFQLLRDYRAAERRFDVVVLDPPKLATKTADVQRAARAYKDLNLLALQILTPGGLLATFSCSGLVSADLFQKIVFGASVDARRDAQIIGRMTQAADHPVLLSFPEGDYLHGLLGRAW